MRQRALILILALPLAAAIVLVIVQGHTTSKLNRSVTAQQVSSYRNALNGREGCVRAVDSREKLIDLIDTLRQTIAHGNRQRQRAWRFYRRQIAVPGQVTVHAPVEAFAQQQISANKGERTGLDAVDPALLSWVRDATAGISKYPASQNPHRVNLVNCNAHYPVPPRPSSLGP
jgi:hypothetical protein